MMGEESKFTLQYGDALEAEATPNNWRDVEMGIARNGVEFGVNREITSEFTFSRNAAEIIRNLSTQYGMKAVCALRFEKRKDDWTYADFNTFKLDFSTISNEGRNTSIRCLENSVRKQIDDNKSTPYDLVLPKDLILDYVGVSKDRTNKLSARNGDTDKYSSSNYFIPSNRTQIAPSDLFTISSKSMNATCKVANTASIELKIGSVYVGTNYTSENCRLQIVKIKTNGSAEVLTSTSGVYCSFEKTGFGGTINGINYAYTARFDLNATYNFTTAFLANEKLAFWWTRGGSSSTFAVCQATGTTLRIITTEASIFQNVQIPIVTYKWAVEQILAKIAPTASLTYNLPVLTSSKGFVTVLTSSTGLQKADAPVITLKFTDLMKALQCEYGADYDVTGSVVRIDYPETFFTATKACDVIPINGVKTEIDTTHVYNKVRVGYETDENAVNGTLEVNCINTFTIESGLTEEKELDLVHPFKGSMYTIEQFMSDKSDDSTKTKTSDNDIFVFAVGNFTTTATLYRTYITQGNLPAMAYNLPISPMRLLMANGKYLGVSYTSIIFSSTGRKADYNCQFPWESTMTYENAMNSSLAILMASPLFLAQKISFETAIRIQDLAFINANLYNYYELVDNNAGKTYKMWIKDITLRLTAVNAQSWVGMIKSIT